MWKRRLLELAIAGGLAGSAGCGPFFGCNANPDPCCRDAQSTQCYDYNHRDLSIRPVTDMSSPDTSSADLSEQD